MSIFVLFILLGQWIEGVEGGLEFAHHAPLVLLGCIDKSFSHDDHASDGVNDRVRHKRASHHVVFHIS